jgi:hypothetical protein
MLRQATAAAQVQNPDEFPLAFNQNGSIDWEQTLNSQTLGDWGLYDAQSAPKLYNPGKGLLIRLPHRQPHRQPHHTFQFVALDNEDDDVAGAYELKTLLEGIDSQDRQPEGEPLEF